MKFCFLFLFSLYFFTNFAESKPSQSLYDAYNLGVKHGLLMARSRREARPQADIGVAAGGLGSDELPRKRNNAHRHQPSRNVIRPVQVVEDIVDLSVRGLVEKKRRRKK